MPRPPYDPPGRQSPCMQSSRPASHPHQLGQDQAAAGRKIALTRQHLFPTAPPTKLARGFAPETTPDATLCTRTTPSTRIRPAKRSERQLSVGYKPACEDFCTRASIHGSMGCSVIQTTPLRWFPRQNLQRRKMIQDVSLRIQCQCGKCSCGSGAWPACGGFAFSSLRSQTGRAPSPHLQNSTRKVPRFRCVGSGRRCLANPALVHSCGFAL